jgi:hypothetical protein
MVDIKSRIKLLLALLEVVKWVLWAEQALTAFRGVSVTPDDSQGNSSGLAPLSRTH